jgi:hypothetical protein
VLAEESLVGRRTRGEEGREKEKSLENFNRLCCCWEKKMELNSSTSCMQAGMIKKVRFCFEYLRYRQKEVESGVEN